MSETGQAVSGFLDVMKTQPLSLLLGVMNVVLLYVLFSVYTKADEARQAQMAMIFKSQSEMQILLSKCVVPDTVR